MSEYTETDWIEDKKSIAILTSKGRYKDAASHLNQIFQLSTSKPRMQGQISGMLFILDILADKSESRLTIPVGTIQPGKSVRIPMRVRRR